MTMPFAAMATRGKRGGSTLLCSHLLRPLSSSLSAASSSSLSSASSSSQHCVAKKSFPFPRCNDSTLLHARHDRRRDDDTNENYSAALALASHTGSSGGSTIGMRSYSTMFKARNPEVSFPPPSSSSSSTALHSTTTFIMMKNFHRDRHHYLRYHDRSFSTSPSSSSSFSSLPPDEENAERQRVSTLSSYAREMELRKLDADIARLQTLRGINTGELYTLRGKFKMLSRDYGMGFLAWYWTVWFGTAALSYAAIEVGGVDPLVVASKVENFLGWEAASISGKLDPTLGRIGLVVAVNECLEPLRLPLVVVTTKPVVNFFTKG